MYQLVFLCTFFYQFIISFCFGGIFFPGILTVLEFYPVLFLDVFCMKCVFGQLFLGYVTASTFRIKNTVSQVEHLFML